MVDRNEALVSDPHLCEAAVIQRDVVRDLVQAGIFTPAVSPRGRGKTRLWARRDFDRIALIEPLRSIGFSSGLAGPLTAQIADDDLHAIYNAPYGTLFRLGVYDGNFALLSAPPIGARLLLGKCYDGEWRPAAEVEAELRAYVRWGEVRRRLPSLPDTNTTERSINATSKLRDARLRLSLIEREG